MGSSYGPPSARQPMFSNAMITGGTFLQQTGTQIYDNRQISIQGAKGGFECLKDAVAPAAFHNSGERFDPPKCHPNTRVRVMKVIMDWILGCDRQTRNALIMWVSGAAGAGKSAIAQSIAELCYAEGRILASFFFSRSDPSRNHAKSLFATIAYQLALGLPQVREKIVATVEYDPLIFTRSLSTQFTSLIVEPLRDLTESGYWNNPSSPRLIIIDGLDECLDRQVQCAILDIILKASQAHHLPLMFLVASRPEHELSMKFNSMEATNALTRLVLDNSYLSHKDIEIFLRDHFEQIKQNHPFNDSIPSAWPTDDVIETLVQKSSGQFIYASTAMKYVKSSRHKPSNRLEIILSLRPPARDLPFSELDALYTVIFASVANIQFVLDILSFKILDTRANTGFMEKMLSLESGEIKMQFCDLGSLITVGPLFVVQHASLFDFLVDKERSMDLHINILSKRTEHLQKCFQFLRETSIKDRKWTRCYIGEAADFICLNFQNAVVTTVELQQELLHFSIDQIYKDVTTFCHQGPYWVLMRSVTPLLISIFRFLHNAQFEDAPRLYARHLQSFDQVLMKHFDFYDSDARLTALVALFVFSMHHQSLRLAIFNWDIFFFPVRQSDVLLMDGQRLCLLWASESDASHVPLLEEFLSNPARSGKYKLDGRRCATTAFYCLKYLCDHGTNPKKSTRRDRCDDLIKINTPWMWRKRIGPRGVLYQSRRMWRKKKSDRMDRQLRWRLANSFGRIIMRKPDVAQHIWSTKYSLNLSFLLYFLPRSDKSQDLVEICRRSTFAPRSQDFPNQSRRSRRVVAEYLDKMESGKAYITRNAMCP